MEEKSPIQVYARCDELGRILDVNSSIFLADTEGWLQIDEGEGDRYAHAQGLYFDNPIRDELGVPRYRVVGGKAEKRPAEDIETDREAAQEEADKQAALQLEQEAIQQAAVTLAMLQAPELSDEQAATVPVLFEAYSDKGVEYAEGDRRCWTTTEDAPEGPGVVMLVKCLKSHTSQWNWNPDRARGTMWAPVEAGGQGKTPETAIPYVLFMAAEEGLYYSWDGKVYRCKESYSGSTGHSPDVLTRYFEEVKI